MLTPYRSVLVTPASCFPLSVSGIGFHPHICQVIKLVHPQFGPVHLSAICQSSWEQGHLWNRRGAAQWTPVGLGLASAEKF